MNQRPGNLAKLTAIEWAVVLGLVALLATLPAPALRTPCGGPDALTLSRLHQIELGLHQIHAQTGAWPHGPDAARRIRDAVAYPQPPERSDLFRDAWGRPIHIRIAVDAREAIALLSCGADGIDQAGAGDDLLLWWSGVEGEDRLSGAPAAYTAAEGGAGGRPAALGATPAKPCIRRASGFPLRTCDVT